MPKLETDTDLIFEADKSGMIHVRKNPGQTEVLPNYGTEDFGVSAYEPIPKRSPLAFVAAGAAGFLAWKFRDRILDKVQVLIDYSLLMAEASKE